MADNITQRERERLIDFVLPVMEIHSTPTAITFEAALIEKKKIKSEFDQTSCLNY